MLQLAPGPRAYYFDKAVWSFGMKVEHDMDVAESRVKKQDPKMVTEARRRVLMGHMAPELPKEATVKRYRDPAAGAGKKKWGVT